MNLLKIPTISCLLVALALPLASPVHAGSFDLPCAQITCIDLPEAQFVSKASKAEGYIPVVSTTFPILEVLLPNLTPTSISTKTWGSISTGTSIEIESRVNNIGDSDAGGFDFRAEVSFIRVDTGVLTDTDILQIFVPYLLKGDSQKSVIGFATPPDNDFDYDVVINIIADSTNAQNGGAVRESNESDNAISMTCRKFGYANGQGNIGSDPAC